MTVDEHTIIAHHTREYVYACLCRSPLTRSKRTCRP
jgi:hypothetical protein